MSLACANGNSLIGATDITCLASGNWSAPLPLCESKNYLGRDLANGSLDHGFFKGVECGDIPLTSYNHNYKQHHNSPGNETTPQVSVLSREVGGRAAFSCPSGAIRGPVESVCLPSGEWSTPFPTCAGKLSVVDVVAFVGVSPRHKYKPPPNNQLPARCINQPNKPTNQLNNQPTNQSSPVLYLRPTCVSCISTKSVLDVIKDGRPNRTY